MGREVHARRTVLVRPGESMNRKDTTLLRLVNRLSDVEYVATTYAEAAAIALEVQAQLVDLIGEEG